MSTLKVNDIVEATSGGGKIFPARVSGTLNGSSFALEQSNGVSSAQDNGVGNYQFNFSNNFSNAQYFACGVSCNYSTTASYSSYIPLNYGGGNIDDTRTTSQCKVGAYEGSYADCPSAGVLCEGP
jgi:hypothetical protein